MGTDNLIDMVDEEKDSLASKLDDFDRLDVERKQLIKKLHDENIALKEELHRKTADYAAELETHRDWQKKAENAALITLQHAQISIVGYSKTPALDRAVQQSLNSSVQQSYNHILVLIDGNNCIFQEKLVQQGMAGGEETARRLNDEVQKRFEYIDPEGAKQCKIMVRVYLDLDGLFQTLRRAGLVQDLETIRHFSRGFSQHQPLFDLVDIGHDSEQVRLKIEEILDLSLNSVQCKQVLLGCHSNDLPKILRQRKQSILTLNRITLLRTARSKAEPQAPFELVELPTVFRSSALPVSIASNDSSEQLAIQNWNNGHLFAESSRSRKHSESLSSFASQISAPLKSRTQGYNASAFPPSNKRRDAESYDPTVDDDTSTPPPNLPTNWGPNQRIVLLNLDDERVDSYLGQIDPTAALRVAERCEEQRICNDFHLRDRCWTPECPYSHEPRLSTQELVALRYKARMLVCEKGPACRSVDCWYGHMCAAENCRKIGCRFKAVHDINKTAVRVWRNPRYQEKREDVYDDFI